MNLKHLKIISYFLPLFLISSLLFYYQSLKEGFHEDEVFSIASSVNPYDGLYQKYSEKDTRTMFLEEYILKGNIFENFSYYIRHISEVDAILRKIDEEKKPIWKTSEDAKNYSTLQAKNIFNFFSIFYNQAKDNHPPLFYLLTHIYSIPFINHFSKYPIFLLNLTFFIASCFVIRKILYTLKKEKLVLSTTLFYGLSMGVISMVLYQRMYMMLSFFCLWYVSILLEMKAQDFAFDKKMKKKLGFATVLGFLTQYYFCILALFSFLIFFIFLAKRKKKEELKSFIKVHLLYALIGCIIFPFFFSHILLSDRGISSFGNLHFIERIHIFGNYLANGFSVSSWIFLFMILFLFIYLVVNKNKTEKEDFLLLFVPSFLYFLLVVKISSFLEFRYIMPVLPFLCISFLLAWDWMTKNIPYQNVFLFLLSISFGIHGLLTQKPLFLYTGYSDCINIAKENASLPFVYIYDNDFNHIQSIPEFLEYEKSIILNSDQGEISLLLNDSVIEESNAMIVSIKNYQDQEDILGQILQNTKFTTYTLLHEGQDDTKSVIYKFQ